VALGERDAEGEGVSLRDADGERLLLELADDTLEGIDVLETVTLPVAGALTLSKGVEDWELRGERDTEGLRESPGEREEDAESDAAAEADKVALGEREIEGDREAASGGDAVDAPDEERESVGVGDTAALPDTLCE
jgi:hypothetical protein